MGSVTGQSGRKVKRMRLIDAGELIEKLHGTAFKDGDDRSIVLNIIDKMPEKDNIRMEKICDELRAQIEYLDRQNNMMKGEIKALTFVVRCNGMSGNEVRYETN